MKSSLALVSINLNVLDHALSASHSHFLPSSGRGAKKSDILMQFWHTCSIAAPKTAANTLINVPLYVPIPPRHQISACRLWLGTFRLKTGHSWGYVTMYHCNESSDRSTQTRHLSLLIHCNELQLCQGQDFTWQQSERNWTIKSIRKLQNFSSFMYIKQDKTRAGIADHTGTRHAGIATTRSGAQRSGGRGYSVSDQGLAV